jgi:hypothetical protein
MPGEVQAPRSGGTAEAASKRLYDMMIGYRGSQLVYVAAKLGIADLIDEGGATVDELASRTGADRNSLLKLLRGLSFLGILSEAPDGRYLVDELGALLRDDAPGGLRVRSIMNGEEQYLAYSQLLHTVMTGEPGFDKALGQGFWAYLDDHPAEAEVFNRSMAGSIGERYDALVEAYDFADVQTVVDVGGGVGGLTCALLEAFPHLHSILFDLPRSAERATVRIEELGLSDRCQVVGGSFFEQIPTGGDAYVLCRVLPDWADFQATMILRSIRSAIGAEARLLVVARLVPIDGSESSAKMLDIHLATLTGGGQRTEAEYRALLDDASFRLERVIPTAGEMSILECRPV